MEYGPAQSSERCRGFLRPSVRGSTTLLPAGGRPAVRRARARAHWPPWARAARM